MLRRSDRGGKVCWKLICRAAPASQPIDLRHERNISVVLASHQVFELLRMAVEAWNLARAAPDDRNRPWLACSGRSERPAMLSLLCSSHRAGDCLPRASCERCCPRSRVKSARTSGKACRREPEICSTRTHMHSRLAELGPMHPVRTMTPGRNCSSGTAEALLTKAFGSAQSRIKVSQTECAQLLQPVPRWQIVVNPAYPVQLR